MKKCTQGSMIFGIRSVKYSGISCYGIVISARCDIAQTKVNKIHFLTAIELNDWIKSELLNIIIHDKIEKIYEKIKVWADERKLDFKSLLELGPTKIIKNINEEQNPDNKSQLITACKSWEKYLSYDVSKMNSDQKIQLLNNDFNSQKKDKLRSLLKGNISSYCFLPQSAYSKSDSKLDGIVVDLREINHIPYQHLDDILENCYDYNIITRNLSNKNEKLKILNEFYVLESKEDIVTICYEIKSPWIEYLMQSFSNAYSRVGVDCAENEEIAAFCSMEIK